MDAAGLFVTAGGLALIAFTLWFFFGGQEEAAPANNVNNGPLYACPMHPWITSTNPADNCSICGMKLVRRDEAKQAG